MSRITDDKNDPGLNNPTESGQNEAYLVLSDEERAKGFQRPYRDTYAHVGIRPTHPLRELTEEEKQRYASCNFVAYEEYPEEHPQHGRFWTTENLNSGCGAHTTMSRKIAETYARDPDFYGATFCVRCARHIRVEEFVWVENGRITDKRVGD